MAFCLFERENVEETNCKTSHVKVKDSAEPIRLLITDNLVHLQGKLLNARNKNRIIWDLSRNLYFGIRYRSKNMLCGIVLISLFYKIGTLLTTVDQAMAKDTSANRFLIWRLFCLASSSPTTLPPTWRARPTLW